jgi:hypothetical protein
MPMKCQPEHLAEVWLAGLLEADPMTADGENPDEIVYHFRPGVRDRLLDGLPWSDAWQVLHQVSDYVERNLGRLRGLRGWLKGETGTQQLFNADDRPFALVAAQVLRRLGGGYAALAETLERQMEGTIVGFGEWLRELCESARRWLNHESHASHHASAQTASYVDLIFSFGLARVGESDASKELLARAEEQLTRLDDAHRASLDAYRYRIHQARDGKPHTGPLPNNQLEKLEMMERLQRYVVDRLRKHSRILEPDQKIDPYRHWGAKISDLEKALAELTDLTDRHQIVNRVEKLLSEVPRGNKGHEQRTRVIRAGLECAPRVNEEFARRMLQQVVNAYDHLPPANDEFALWDRAVFLRESLFVAAHFDHIEHIHPLVNRFQQMLETQRGPQSIQPMNTLAGQCFRSLRKLGMRDEIAHLLRLMAEVILEGKDLAGVDFKKMDHGIDALQALLGVAAGWYYCGRDSQAEPVLQKTRDLLFRGELQARDKTKLACSYAETVGQAPPEMAQKLLSEVFEKLKGVKDTYTSSMHFSVSQLEVVEAVVMGVFFRDLH